MAFRVGQKVVCIGSDGTSGIDWRSWVAYWKITLPVRGAVYTIREVRLGRTRQLVRLAEIVNPSANYTDAPPQEPWFWAEAFRPLTYTNSSVSFTEGAPLDSERYDNRRKLPAKVSS